MTEQYEMDHQDIIKVLDKRRYKREASEAFVTDDGSVDASEDDRCVESDESGKSTESVKPIENVGTSIVYNISGNSRCVFKVTITESAPEMSR